MACYGSSKISCTTTMHLSITSTSHGHSSPSSSSSPSSVNINASPWRTIKEKIKKKKNYSPSASSTTSSSPSSTSSSSSSSSSSWKLWHGAKDGFMGCFKPTNKKQPAKPVGPIERNDSAKRREELVKAAILYCRQSYYGHP